MMNAEDHKGCVVGPRRYEATGWPGGRFVGEAKECQAEQGY